jgi:hypothetical protein
MVLGAGIDEYGGWWCMSPDTGSLGREFCFGTANSTKLEHLRHTPESDGNQLLVALLYLPNNFLVLQDLKMHAVFFPFLRWWKWVSNTTSAYAGMSVTLLAQLFFCCIYCCWMWPDTLSSLSRKWKTPHDRPVSPVWSMIPVDSAS